jgi:hypothetical protein
MGAFDLADDDAALFDHLQDAGLNNQARHPGISTASAGGDALSGLVSAARFPSGAELKRAGRGRWTWDRREARLVLPSVVSDHDERFRGVGAESSGSVQAADAAQASRQCVSLHESAAQEWAAFGPSSRKRHFMTRTPDAIARAQAFAIVTGHASVMTP